MRQSWEIAQLAVFVARNVVDLADGGKHLCLLDRIDAQVRFQIQIQIEHVDRVTGLLGYQSEYSLFHRVGLAAALAGRKARLRRWSGAFDSATSCVARVTPTGTAATVMQVGGAGGTALWPDWPRRRSGFHRARRRPLISHTQRAVHHFQLRRRMARHAAQPRVPRSRIGNAIRVAQRIGPGRTPSFVVTQRNSVMLIWEPKPAPRRKRVLDGIDAALRQIQWTQFGIDFLEVGHGRHASGFQRLHRDHIFDAGAHGVAGEALGIGDHDLIRGVAEDVTQGMDLRRGAAAARGRVGFVRNEHRLRRDLMAGNAAVRFGLGDQILHHLADVLDIETRAVERAVGRHRAQHFADGLNSAFARGFRALHHQGRGAHADNHAVPAAVEGNGGLFHHLVGGCRSAGQKAGADPLHQMVGSDVVRRDDDHAAAAPGADPVLRQCHGLRGARAGGVDLRVGTAGADEFGKLRMSHGQNSEQEAPVEDIRLFFDGGAQLLDTPVQSPAPG